METKTKSSRSALQPDRETQNEIVIERILDLHFSKVWRAWTEPENLKKWWGPDDYSCPSSSIDLKKGGKYLNCMRSPDGENVWSTGVFKEIIPNKKLVFTDSFADEDGNVIPASAYNMPGDWPRELLITVKLEDISGKTNLTLTHSGIPDEGYEDCIQGWNKCLDKLERNIS